MTATHILEVLEVDNNFVGLTVGNLAHDAHVLRLGATLAVIHIKVVHHIIELVVGLILGSIVVVIRDNSRTALPALRNKLGEEVGDLFCMSAASNSIISR